MRTNYSNNTIMEVNGLKCVINTPKAIEDKKDEVHSLPPYAKQDVFLVDEYESCPENWIHGSSNSSSYFLGVQEGTGLWLDFNQNCYNTHDVAVVVSIQGINPITGQKTLKTEMEQYIDKCPVHNKEFQQDRFCPKCKFKWPKQNYLSTASCFSGQFWLDGFRMPDGKVRQWVFTKDTIRGVAKNIIGEDRVFAIGLAFYKSKKPKQTFDYEEFFKEKFKNKQPYKVNSPNVIWEHKFMYDSDVYGSETPISCNSMLSDNVKKSPRCLRGFVETEKFEVAAGAQISQEVREDSNSLDYWEKTPSGFIYINYDSVENISKIIQNGKRKEISEGFLANIPTGN